MTIATKALIWSTIVSKAKVLVVVQGGVCQEVFLELNGIPREDIQIGVIDWDELEFGSEECQIGFLVNELDVEMDYKTKYLAERIFKNDPPTVEEFQKWCEENSEDKFCGD